MRIGKIQLAMRRNFERLRLLTKTRTTFSPDMTGFRRISFEIFCIVARTIRSSSTPSKREALSLTALGDAVGNAHAVVGSARLASLWHLTGRKS
ncbi:MAG: hypothetical protein J0H38_16980 [Rhizobiales bacterium]|nr:hypothetical protein [Hyphomicrobiales bacterium]